MSHFFSGYLWAKDQQSSLGSVRSPHFCRFSSSVLLFGRKCSPLILQADLSLDHYFQSFMTRHHFPISQICSFISRNREKVKQRTRREKLSERTRDTSVRADAGLGRTCTMCVAISLLYLCGLHLSNGFWQVGGDFWQPFSSAVHYVVAAGAGLWTLQHTACRRWWRVVT